jgi:Zn-dependent protease
MRSKFTLLTMRGIPVGVDWSWFFVLFLVIWLLSGYYSDLLLSPEDSIEPYALAVVSALGFFGSILLHEFGHAIVALRNKIGITSITLWMFGGIAGLKRDPDTPGVEFRIAAAGPAVTLVIAAACLIAGTVIDGGSFWESATFDEGAAVSPAVAVLAWTGWINATILVFNLLPAFPLDGGRILRAIVWKLTGDRDRGTRFAARLGQVFAVLIVGLGVLLALTGAVFSGIWLAVVGWMLGQSARVTFVQSDLNKKLGGLTVSDVMDDEPVAIPSDTTVERALDEYFLRYRWPWFPVVDAAQHFVGLVNRGAADAVPEVSRTSRTVSELLDSGAGETEQLVRSDAPIESLLANLELRRLGGLAVVGSDGRLTGVVTIEQVGRALRNAVGSSPFGEDGRAS